MNNDSILTCMYAEYQNVRRKIREIDKERARLDAHREVLADFELWLRNTMSDYGDFVAEDYRPKESADND